MKIKRKMQTIHFMIVKLYSSGCAFDKLEKDKNLSNKRRIFHSILI